MPRRRALASAVWLAAGAASCQLAIGKTELTQVRCEQEAWIGPPACAAGQYCARGLCTSCVDVEDCNDDLDNDCDGVANDGCEQPDAGADAEEPDQGVVPDDSQPGEPEQEPELDAAHEPEVPVPDVPGDTVRDPGVEQPDEPKPPAPMGEPCASHAECETNLCLAVASLGNRCTKHCCSSASDCPTGFVCVPGFGANLCAKGSAVGMPPGSGALGSPCSKPDECVSGRCRPGSPQGSCVDVCCKDSDCMGKACAQVSVGGADSWYCAAWKPTDKLAAFADCYGDSECASSVCSYAVVGEQCRPPCCADGDCGSGAACRYGHIAGRPVRQCFGPMTGAGRPPVCCADANCAAEGKRCLPALETLRDEYGFGDKQVWVLRCQ